MMGMKWFGKLSKPAKVGVLAGSAAMVLVLAASAGVFDSKSGASALPSFVVQRGPLTINVVDTGTIKPRQQEIIKSDVEGNTTIIYLIPEGTLVKTGDLMIQLDVSKLEENLLNQQITMQNAEASFIRAREQFSMTQTQTEIDVTKAKLDYQFSQEDLSNYFDGEYPKLLMEADNKITLAREQMEQAKEKLRWSERLFQEKYLSQTEFESDRLALQRAKLDHDLSVANKDLLERFTHERKLNTLRTNVDQMKRALDKALSKSNADIVQAEADLRAKEAEFERQKQRLAKIEEQISKTRLYAPRAGMVVYATSAQGGGYRGNTEPLAEGQQVRERQELIFLPTAAEFDVQLKVHESSLEKISLGQPVRITVDALPGVTFTGAVSRIAPLPDPTSVWLNPDLKVYTTTVQIEGDHPNLRTGMSCRAEIIVDQYEDVLYVPVQSVLRVNGRPTVWMIDGDKQTPKVVKVGLDNNRMIHITEGLAAGERVSLSPPLAAAGADESSAEAPNPGPAGSAAATKPAGTRPTAPTNPPGQAGSATPNGPPGGVQPVAGVGVTPGDTGATNPADALKPTQPPQANPATVERPAGERGAGLSQEERDARRKRFESMTPEQREQLRETSRRQREQSGNQPGGVPAPGGPAAQGDQR